MSLVPLDRLRTLADRSNRRSRTLKAEGRHQLSFDEADIASALAELIGLRDLAAANGDRLDATAEQAP